MRISDWSSDVCSSDLILAERLAGDGDAIAVEQPFGKHRLHQHVDAACHMSVAELACIPVCPWLIPSRSPRFRAPNVGLSAQLPLKLAGRRIDPTNCVPTATGTMLAPTTEIGRASCRERVCQYV